MNRAKMLINQALERWQNVPADKKTKLLEELKQQGLKAAIELDPPILVSYTYSNYECAARVVDIAFGKDNSHSDKRYLTWSNIPK